MNLPFALRRTWWLDIVVPLLLSFLLFAGMFFLVYSGQKHRSISSQMERRFIEYSLRVAGPSKSEPVDKIEIISLSKSDESEFTFSDTNDYRDISIKSYAMVLRKVIAQNPDVIYLNWVPSAHDPEDSYTPLIEELKKTDKSKVQLSLRMEHEQLLPPELLKYVSIVSNDACLGRSQIVCSYGKNWNFWIPQNIVNRFGPKDIDPKNSNIVTLSLPPMFPGYLIYLQDQSDFNTSTFSDVSKTNESEGQFTGKSVFIGNSLFQQSKGAKDYYLELGRVRTAISEEGGDIRSTGVPFHVYWAQTAQMFMSKKFVAAPSVATVWVITGMFVVFILMVLLKFGTPLSLGVFLIFALSSPLVNAFSIKYFNVYIPVFDSIFGGISAFLFASFGKLSISAYKRWWIRVQKKQDEESRDLKVNFISLISHNLNTPVAKMQGMLDLVEQYSENADTTKSAQSANSTVAEIQLCIKSVLSLNALDEGSLNRESVTVNNLIVELRSQYNNSLKRMGICLDLDLLDQDDELNMLPMSLDKRIFSSLIAGAATLFFDSKNVNLRGAFQVIESETRDSFIRCSVICDDLNDSEKAAKLFEKISGTDRSDTTLFEEVSLNLLKSFDKSNFGVITLKDVKKTRCLDLDFYPESAAH